MNNSWYQQHESEQYCRVFVLERDDLVVITSTKLQRQWAHVTSWLLVRWDSNLRSGNSNALAPEFTGGFLVHLEDEDDCGDDDDVNDNDENHNDYDDDDNDNNNNNNWIIENNCLDFSGTVEKTTR